MTVFGEFSGIPEERSPSESEYTHTHTQTHKKKVLKEEYKGGLGEVFICIELWRLGFKQNKFKTDDL